MSNTVLNSRAIEHISKTVAKTPQVKFTVGTMQDGETSFQVFDSTGQTDYQKYKYETASVGKTFTASLLAKLVSEGKMNLGAPVSDYITELDNGDWYPTLLQLATHKSGYPSLYPLTRKEVVPLAIKQIRGQIKKAPVRSQDYLSMDYDRMISLTKNAKLKDKDHSWRYSNFGYGLLGYAIASVLNRPFWDAMNDFLREDLGLKNTFLGTESTGMLAGYNHLGQNTGNWNLGPEDFLTPSGNISSTAEDLLAFAKMNIDKAPEYLELCQTRYNMKSKHSDMGLGWWIDYKNPDIYYHGGNIDGFSSLLAFDRGRRNAVVLLANYYSISKREALFKEILENLSRG